MTNKVWLIPDQLKCDFEYCICYMYVIILKANRSLGLKANQSLASLIAASGGGSQ